MAELEVAFRLDKQRRAQFISDYGMSKGRCLVDGAEVISIPSYAALRAGVSRDLAGLGRITVRADEDFEVRMWVDEVEAPREDRVVEPISRSAWHHAWLALSGSGLGFIASWLYLRRAEASGDPWALKMAMRMAAWHLMLTLTLFPASLWGRRVGTRAVQGAALVFFFIHLGIALANTGSHVAIAEGPWLALLNGASGIAFFVTVVYGQRAHADMSRARA